MPWVTAGTFPFDKDVWELYNLNEDFSETENLAEKNPEKLEELKKEWDEQAWKNNVYPLYDDINSRLAKQFSRAFGDRKSFTYYSPGAQRIPEAVSAPIKNISHTIETTLDLKGDEEGVIVACGGVNGGYTLFIADHKLHYDYNYFNSSPLFRRVAGLADREGGSEIQLRQNRNAQGHRRAVRERQEGGRGRHR